MRHQVGGWKHGSGLCTGQALWEALAQGWVGEVIWEQLIDEVEAQGFVWYQLPWWGSTAAKAGTRSSPLHGGRDTGTEGVPASPLLWWWLHSGPQRGCQPHPSPGGGCTQDHRGGASLTPPLAMTAVRTIEGCQPPPSPRDGCTQGHGGAASLPPSPGGGCTLRTLDLGGTLAVTWSEPCSDRCKPSG